MFRGLEMLNIKIYQQYKHSIHLQREDFISKTDQDKK